MNQKIIQVLNLYETGEISFGKAAELVGLREDDLALKACENCIYPKYSDKTILEELE